MVSIRPGGIYQLVGYDEQGARAEGTLLRSGSLAALVSDFALVADRDGATIVTWFDRAESDLLIERFAALSVMDATFGKGGVVRTSIGRGTAVELPLVPFPIVQKNGRLVVGARSCHGQRCRASLYGYVLR